MDAFNQAMGLIEKAIAKEEAKQAEYKKAFDTACHCEKPIRLVVSDENDTYISCRNCGGEL